MEIPAEHCEDGDQETLARLTLSLVRHSISAQNCTAEWPSYLSELGFETGHAIPCNFKHVSRELFMTAHSDGSSVTSGETELKWTEAQMVAKYHVKTNFFGPSSPHEQEVRVFNRVLR